MINMKNENKVTTPPKIHNSPATDSKNIKVDEISDKKIQKDDYKNINEFQGNNWIKKVSTGCQSGNLIWR